jgi:hypothetical protein
MPFINSDINLSGEKEFHKQISAKNEIGKIQPFDYESPKKKKDLKTKKES